MRKRRSGHNIKNDPVMRRERAEMQLYKVFWALRAFTCRATYGRVGNFSYLGRPVSVVGRKNIYLGNKVRIYPGSRMETLGEGKIIIKDDCSIAQNFHCTAGGMLVIGRHTTILGNVYITDIRHEYQNIGVHIMEQPIKIEKTEIGENCFIGFGAAIQPGTILGKQCIVGAHSLVTGEFPDYCVIVGCPAKIIKKYDLDLEKWIRVEH